MLRSLGLIIASLVVGAASFLAVNRLLPSTPKDREPIVIQQGPPPPLPVPVKEAKPGKPAPSQGTNLALGRPTRMSSLLGDAATFGPNKGVDGVITDESIFHTDIEDKAFWQVDLGRVVTISEIELHNRIGCCRERADGLLVLVSVDEKTWVKVFEHQGASFGGGPGEGILIKPLSVKARFVRTQLPAKNYLHLSEVIVRGS